MSRTNLRALLLLGAAAFLLRASCAILTEYKPIFPSYYFTDASLVDDVALKTIGASRDRKDYFYPGSLSQRLQVSALVVLYTVVGPRPLAAKLVNAALGAAAAGLLAFALIPLFGATAALAAGALVAVWPSAVFFTAHNLKEAPLAFVAYAALAAALPLFGAGKPRARIAGRGLLALAAFVGVGLCRPPVLLALCAALGAGFAWEFLKSRRAKPGVVAGLLCCLLAPVLYAAIARTLTRLNVDPKGQGMNVTESQVGLIPNIHDGKPNGRTYRPLSPQGLTDFRATRAFHDRHWAVINKGRAIGTQLFPDERFESWGDVLLFLPKSAFFVLYMPLPGVYPLEGKLGRMLAAAENLLLLALSVAGLAGAAFGSRTPARAALILFFVAMTVGSALLELDLGSSARHKLLYLPLLFPFAAEHALKRFGVKELS